MGSVYVYDTLVHDILLAGSTPPDRKERHSLTVKLIATVVISCSLLASCVGQVVSDKERQIFAPVSLLTAYGINLPEDHTKYEKYSKRMYYDNTFELEYEYDPPSTVTSVVRYMDERYSFENRSSDTMVNELIQNTVSGAIWKANGITLAEEQEVFSWGRRSMLYDVLSKDKLAVGNYFVASVEKVAFTFVVIGAHISQGEVWSELLKSRLDKSREFSIGFYKLNAQ